MPNGKSIPGPNLPFKLAGHSMVNVNYTHTLIIAGRRLLPPSSRGPISTTVSNTWYFNHEDQTFTEGPELNNSREFFSVGLVKDSVTKENLIIVAGGSTEELQIVPGNFLYAILKTVMKNFEFT